MTINLQQLTALLPFVILLLTIAMTILSIACYRNHFFVAVVSIISLSISFLSLFSICKILPVDINFLFHINSCAVLYIGMILLSSITTCIFAYPWLVKYQFNKEEFYVLILISTLGSILLIISNHMASFFINLELISLPIFGLIAYSNCQEHALEAAFKYVILSVITSSFLLLGIAWIYSISGNLSFISIYHAFHTSSPDEKIVILFGFSMILLSLFSKLSIVPFHLWTPDIYEGTPTPVLSFFSTASKISIFNVLLYFLLNISILNNEILYFLLSLITIFSILVGNLMALFQENMKRFFGYSSISQFGCLFIVLLVSEKSRLFSLEASGMYLCSYLFSNIAYFGIINLISNSHEKNKSNLISSYQGLFWSQPLLSSILTIVLFSLSGIPMTLGFIGKFYILSIIVREQLWILGFSFCISSILGLYCYFRIIQKLYSMQCNLSGQNLNVLNNWIYTPSGIVICISGIILLVLGIYPNPLISLVR